MSVNPAVRTYIYNVATAVTPLVVASGLISSEQAPLWLAVVAAVLAALPPVLSLFNTTKDTPGARKALYGVAAVVLPLLVGYGMVSPDQSQMWLAVAGAVFAAAPSAVARENVGQTSVGVLENVEDAPPGDGL
jgi:hypothetical protein